MSKPIFNIPRVSAGDDLWFWKGHGWRDFLTEDFLPQFPVTLGRQHLTTEKGTPYETFALHVRVRVDEASDAKRALFLVAQEQLRRASERGTVVLRMPPTITEIRVGDVSNEVKVQVRMRYALEDKQDG